MLKRSASSAITMLIEVEHMFTMQNARYCTTLCHKLRGFPTFFEAGVDKSLFFLDFMYPLLVKYSF
jgi:hypothetical protein